MDPWALLVLLGAALPSCHGSMVDVDTALVFHGDPKGAFGHTVAQFGTSDDGWVLVGAPLEHGATGSIHRCRYRTGTCQEVPIRGPPDATNASLGLALSAGDKGALACGPTLPHTCGENVHLNGFCALLDTNLQQLKLFPMTQPECPKRATDVVLLIDGSGSIKPEEFQTMKVFIEEVMRRFKGTDTQFALSQFSHIVVHHFDFKTFRRVPDPIALVGQVRQLKKSTHTATAIWTALTELFTVGSGAREDATKVLIVVTDGRKFDDRMEYRDVIPLAERMGVTRYAIGVGSAFHVPAAVAELQTIASHPTEDHVFRVDNFDALRGIQNQLQEKIFAIEGTASTHSSSFQLEMAQEGFSALLTPEGPILGAVGAFSWAGGAFLYGDNGATTFLNASGGTSDSYLGYAMEPLSLPRGRALALGAPRSHHVGRVLLLQPHSGEVLAQAMGTQVGSYFGASLCSLDPDGDGTDNVVLVGAPMFYGANSGGRVVICSLRTKGGQLQCPGTLRGRPGHPLGRFGSSVAPLGDVDGDGWPEVAIGAPMEDAERGVIYVFRGHRHGVSVEYSQRISGSSFSSSPHHFGQALSGGRDLSGDNLPDVAIGAHGQVLLLRSRPLLKVQVLVAFEPQQVPVSALGCQEVEKLHREVAKAKICFRSSKRTPDSYGSQVATRLQYRVALDPGRTVVRAVFVGGGDVLNGSIQLRLGQQCRTYPMALVGCPRDTVTPLVLRLVYEAIGEPLEVAGGLRPGLSEDTEMVAEGKLPFNLNCGPDNICMDDLHLSINISGVETVVLGVTDGVDVAVTLRNRGESSPGTMVELQHHPALSYRKVLVLQASRSSMSLQCHSEPASGLLRSTFCMVNPPILPHGAEVVFVVTLDVPLDAELGPVLEVVAKASSDSSAPGPPKERIHVPVKIGVFLSISSSSSNPSAGPLIHHYEVKLWGQRGLPINITFRVPTALRETPLWGSLELTPNQDPRRCRAVAERPPTDPDGARRLPQRPLVNCAVASCREFLCPMGPMEPPQVLRFGIGGELSVGWMKELGLPKALLQSGVRLSFDVGRYQNMGGQQELQLQTEVEHSEPPNLLPHIVGGSLGGLLLLALLSMGLYKIGFFRRRYKELMETPVGDPQ
ncbi:integrin alpha-D-like [Ara ararauna]